MAETTKGKKSQKKRAKRRLIVDEGHTGEPEESMSKKADLGLQLSPSSSRSMTPDIIDDVINSADDVIHGDDDVKNGEDGVINGEDAVINGGDDVINGEDDVINGDDGVISGEDEVTFGEYDMTADVHVEDDDITDDVIPDEDVIDNANDDNIASTEDVIGTDHITDAVNPQSPSGSQNTHTQNKDSRRFGENIEELGGDDTEDDELVLANICKKRKNERPLDKDGDEYYSDKPMIIKVTDQQGNSLVFRMLPDTQFRKVMNIFATRRNIHIADLRYLVDGTVVKARDTPRDLALQDGDVIEVFRRQTGGN